MESAELERTTVDLGTTGRDGKPYAFRTTGSVVKFDGFLKLYQEGLDEGKMRIRVAYRRWRAAIALESTRSPPSAFHRAAAALFGSLAHQE